MLFWTLSHQCFKCSSFLSCYIQYFPIQPYLFPFIPRHFLTRGYKLTTWFFKNSPLSSVSLYTCIWFHSTKVSFSLKLLHVAILKFQDSVAFHCTVLLNISSKLIMLLPLLPKNFQTAHLILYLFCLTDQIQQIISSGSFINQLRKSYYYYLIMDKNVQLLAQPADLKWT